MVHNFDSLDAFGTYLERQVPRAMRGALENELRTIGKAVSREAKSSIGTYQAGIGPYPAWAPLAASTVARKGHNRPLIDTGELRKSISFRAVKSAMVVHIGTDLKYAEYTEYGTSTAPPRPIFGPALFRVLPKVLPEVQKACVQGLVGYRLSSSQPGGSTEERGFDYL